MRSASTAVPLSVATSESSITSLPFVTWMFGHAPGPQRTSSSARFATASICRSHVHSDARRLDLEANAVVRGGDRRELHPQPLVQLDQLRCEPLDEAEVEFGAVTADQVHLAREARERGEVAKSAARDDGDGRLWQGGERTDGGDCLGQRLGPRRVVDEGRERSVVITRDQELGHPRDPAQRSAQLGVQDTVGGGIRQRGAHARSSTGTAGASATAPF